MTAVAAPAAAARVHRLEASGLQKSYGVRKVVKDVRLAVDSGEVVGLLGPNGAGKTTTLSMATGLLRPDAGTAWVHGVDVWADPVAAKAMIGNLADGVRLFDRLTGEQLITYTAMMFSVPREQIAELTGLLGAPYLNSFGSTETGLPPASAALQRPSM